MESTFNTPTFIELFPNEKRFTKLLREYLRYHLHKIWCSSQCYELNNYLTNNPLWAALFKQNLYRFNTLLETYCDKKFNKKERLNAIITHFNCAEKLFGAAYCNQLVKDREICLIKLSDELSLYLSINQIDPQEGFFSLNIQNNDKKHIYDASFTLLSKNQLLISSIQGPNTELSQLLIKSATKQLYGVRPMFMLVNIFKLIAQYFNLELLGIHHKNQAKYRWNDHSKLLFNYNLFWQENGGTLNSNNYWRLPTILEKKELSSIPSKKRSMYKKRYELFEKIEQELKERW
ncbi:VirK/YbjX family protein [Mannheimia indoligenes]|uniref:VirK/YbjX family protein n=1 Tax=Mannheimia indoligenes TaxID=3103145 RepID=A0ABU7ZFH9_9PAST